MGVTRRDTSDGNLLGTHCLKYGSFVVTRKAEVHPGLKKDLVETQNLDERYDKAGAIPHMILFAVAV